MECKGSHVYDDNAVHFSTRAPSFDIACVTVLAINTALVAHKFVLKRKLKCFGAAHLCGIY